MPKTETPKDPKCPQCGGPLHRVTYPSGSYMNRDQWEAMRAGDWYCTACEGSRSTRGGHRYYWDHELVAAEPYPVATLGE